MAPTLRKKRSEAIRANELIVKRDTDNASTVDLPPLTTSAKKQGEEELTKDRLVSLGLTSAQEPKCKLRLHELVAEQVSSPWWSNFADIPEAEQKSFLRAASDFTSVQDELFEKHTEAKEIYARALEFDAKSFAKLKPTTGPPATTPDEHDDAHKAVSLAQAKVKETRDAIAEALEAYTKLKNRVERTLVLEATKACTRDNIAATIETRKMWLEHGKILGIPWNETPSYLKFSRPEPDDSLIHPEPILSRRRKPDLLPHFGSKKRRIEEKD